MKFAAALVLSLSALAPFSYMRRADANAVSADDSLKLADVPLLERLLTAGQKVTVERGGQQTVEVKLSDPSR